MNTKNKIAKRLTSKEQNVNGQQCLQNGKRCFTPQRRGMTLVVVMLVISLSVVISLSLVQTQTTNLQIQDNSLHGNIAGDAAKTGLMIALQKMQSTDWEGIDKPVEGVLQTGNGGTAGYQVLFSPISTSQINPLPIDSFLYLVVTSTGYWDSSRSGRIEQRAEMVVKLQPRLPGRTVSSGDNINADDRSAHSRNYDDVQKFALFATGNSVSANSLSLSPGSRISGDIWLKKSLSFYLSPKWNSSVYKTTLDSIGENLSAGDGLKQRHPLHGKICFYETQTSSTTDALQRVKTNWEKKNTIIPSDSIDFSKWRDYQIYKGGPVYQATLLESSLSNENIVPSLTNPLGIFYRNGSITLGDKVTIRGTLVATEEITFSSGSIKITSYDWQGIVANQQLWPRLPAIVAKTVTVNSDVDATINGAVIAETELKSSLGDYQETAEATVLLTGMATVQTVQTIGVVTVAGATDIPSAITDSGYEIWLDDGTQSGWFPITRVLHSQKMIQITGGFASTDAIPFKIRQRSEEQGQQKRFFDIYGPVTCGRLLTNCPPLWGWPGSSKWKTFRNQWLGDSSAPEWIDWLANPANFQTGNTELNQRGLTLEPTFQIRNDFTVRHHWSPPLFSGYVGTGNNKPFSGYRWTVLSWRVLP